MDFVTPLIVNELASRKDFDRRSVEGRVQYKQLKRAHMRTRLAEAQNWKCCYCGCVMTEVKNTRRTVTIEHVNPISVSNDGRWENLAAACAHCNSLRGTLSYEDFMKLKEARGGISKAESRAMAKIRKHVKRAENLHAAGWQDASYDQWIATIRLPSKYKTKLIEQIEQLMPRKG